MPKNMAASVRQRLLNLSRERHEDFDYVLRQYVMQRKTAISKEPLSLFSNDFTQDEDKQIQWQAFLGKNSIEDASSFYEMMQDLQRFLEPVCQASS